MEIWYISSRPTTGWKKIMAGIKDILKKEQSQIADDEYYASLQSLFERDPGAKKYFNPDDITYPAMDKSGDYNYKGLQIPVKDSKYVENYMKERGIDKIYSPESTFMEKVEKGQYPVAILEEPVKTGTEPGDLDKIMTIVHEARHKTMMKPEFKEIMNKYGLKEETFVRYLDKEFFPEVDVLSLPEFKDPKKADAAYKKGVEEYKDKFGKEEKSFLDIIKNMFAKGGQVDKALPGRSRDI